jgi:hypothetical protein
MVDGLTSGLQVITVALLADNCERLAITFQTGHPDVSRQAGAVPTKQCDSLLMNLKTSSPTPKVQSASEPASGDFLSPFNRALAEMLRPAMVRVEELFEDIEIALANGHTQAQVAEALKAEKVDISPKTLAVYLHRLRQRKQFELLQAADRAKAAAPMPPQGPDESPGTNPSSFKDEGSHK